MKPTDSNKELPAGWAKEREPLDEGREAFQ